jgi:hypothetical protein
VRRYTSWSGDAHDRRGQGLDDVGRVQPAAEPDLQHRHVDPKAAEVGERRGGQHLEEGRVRLEHTPAHEPARRVADRPDRGREVAVADLAAVDRDPLVDPHQVR